MNQSHSKQPNFTFLQKIQLPPAIASINAGADPTLLPVDFEPREFDVVCGRGKGMYNRKGNVTFRNIVQSHVYEYIITKNKMDKTIVLNSIISQVREQGEGGALFVKRGKDGRWMDIGDDQAREKCGHALREAIDVCLAPIDVLHDVHGYYYRNQKTKEDQTDDIVRL
jgi:hypothetical protein